MAEQNPLRPTERIIDSHTPAERIPPPPPTNENGWPAEPYSGHTPLDIVRDLERNPPSSEQTS